MKYHTCLSITVLIVVFSGCRSKSNAEQTDSRRPNIIFIMSDDHAAHAITAYGGIYDELAPTPNIDRLADEGMLLRNVFCTNAICGPSRACILTGKYSHVNGYYKNVYGGQFNTDQWTFPEALQKNGYQTGLFGKWHLGSNYPYRPMDRGFDEWLGQGDGGTGTTDDWFDNDRVNDHYWYNGERVQRDGYAPDVFFDAAVDFIQQSDKPFFAYLATYMPHSPHTLQE